MDIRAILMGLVFALMWSSAFTSARMIVVDAPPLTALALRFLLSGVIGVGLALLLGQSWRLTRPQWRSTIVFGLMQNAAYLGLYFLAMQRIGASVAAIIASTMPLMVALAGWAVYRDRLRPMAVAGLIVGFGGVVLIMGARLQGGVDAVGIALCIIGAMALTIATLSVRGASGAPGNLLMIVGLQMLVGSAATGVFALLFESWEVRWSMRLVLAFLYTTLVPGLLATWVWFALVARIGAVKAATFHFLNPFFGVLIAWVLLGERIGLMDVMGVAIIAAGILAVQLSRQTAAR
ncbi:Threonine/homoserine efflux transporter RhtA [Gemmobacter megaterium]|uniref:Threonine/homoserine efflux transporter RhtA n=1 Tax=Gemmobacter megaterium TaxID=1086013 RepID=A0A1N7P070_9RHOB|nr:DMT family transporter [Gemmobacter megaterium]GGE15426.1 peptide ABC transporter permease [Gemmobacter megaterium]SIT03970.1 Threonine/homoserine efflux transporter RhtA [Gemmobacter megaterium]